jgi:hypothetical protein
MQTGRNQGYIELRHDLYNELDEVRGVEVTWLKRSLQTFKGVTVEQVEPRTLINLDL